MHRINRTENIYIGNAIFIQIIASERETRKYKSIQINKIYFHKRFYWSHPSILKQRMGYFEYRMVNEKILGNTKNLTEEMSHFVLGRSFRFLTSFLFPLFFFSFNIRRWVQSSEWNALPTTHTLFLGLLLLSLLQTFLRYSSWSQKCCGLDGLNFFIGYQVSPVSFPD